VSVPDFEFALQLSDHDAGDDMLRDLVRSVLGRVGYAVGAIDELLSLIGAARAHEPAVPCHMRFHVHAGELHIAVTSGDREWQTRRPLP
jgi:hypothetical protein